MDQTFDQMDCRVLSATGSRASQIRSANWPAAIDVMPIASNAPVAPAHIILVIDGRKESGSYVCAMVVLLINADS